MHQLSKAQHEEVRDLAYQLWEKRGRPLGSADEDWFLAERDLLERSDWPARQPLSSLTMEPRDF